MKIYVFKMTSCIRPCYFRFVTDELIVDIFI